jgi:hypothetical protein
MNNTPVVAGCLLTLRGTCLMISSDSSHAFLCSLGSHREFTPRADAYWYSIVLIHDPADNYRWTAWESGPALFKVRSHRRHALDIRMLHPANRGGKCRRFHKIVAVCLLVPTCDRVSMSPFSLWRGAPVCADPEPDPDNYQGEDDALVDTSYSMFEQIGNILTTDDVSCDMNDVRWFSTGYDRQTERTKSSMMYCALLPEA